MADSSAQFQADAFDFGFDVSDIPPVLYKVEVQPTVGKIKAGQSVTITAYIIDDTTTPGRKFPFSLPTLPTITLYKPDNTVYQAATDMGQIGNGVYWYIKDTDIADSLGVYTAVFNATNGTSTLTTQKYVVFSII